MQTARVFNDGKGSILSEAYSVALSGEDETIVLGKKLTRGIDSETVIIYLIGDLGAGKTTFARGLVQAYGHTGAVKSPTYTLVENYELLDKNIYHFDFYRIASPEEVGFLGIHDYFSVPNSISLIEWPCKAKGVIPEPHLTIELQDRLIDEVPGRQAILNANSDYGRRLIQSLYE